MEQKAVLKKLEMIFWILGWVALAITIVGVLATVYRHLNPATISFDEQKITLPRSDDLSLVFSLKVLLQGFGEAFFAFLMSAVFRMTRERQPVNLDRAQRYLMCSCAGLTGAGLISLTSFIFGVQQWLSFDLALNSTAAIVLTLLSGIANGLMPFLYAFTIYILFQQFSRLITFESETA